MNSKSARKNEPGSEHSFYIPVMGIGFTADTPLKVARYGISSVISLVDDTFLEQMRRYHSEREDEPYSEIGRNVDDSRALRITAYLDLVDRLVERQVRQLKASPFEEGSEITRYYDLLPDVPLKETYRKMLATVDPVEKGDLQAYLRSRATPGSIDVNIMTKVDRENYRAGKPLPPEYSDAKAALRGYANSTLNSSIVFSAGLNPQLYSYIARFPDFYPDETGTIRKRIVLKVSDYRSAEVQAKFLAKRGLWVSEFRIESGMNCGGHAFAAKGHLMGPILEEFKARREELAAQIHDLLKRSSAHPHLPRQDDMRITVAGGIGTCEEHDFLLRYYNVDKAGWGTPFLLVPEVTNVDEEHLVKLCQATADDVYLSAASPLKISFWNLRTSASEEARRRHIAEGKPGSVCPKGHGKIFDTEFTKHPECISARNYITRKVRRIQEEEHSAQEREQLLEEALAKSCICHDLSGGATIKYGIDPEATPAVCCGPGIVNFSRIATLEEMVGHIYGRLSLLTNSCRPHMFIKEMSLYIEYLKEEMRRFSAGVVTNAPSYFQEFKENLLSGIEYYRGLAEQFVEEKRKHFLKDLQEQRNALEGIFAFMQADLVEATG